MLHDCWHGEHKAVEGLVLAMKQEIGIVLADIPTLGVEKQQGAIGSTAMIVNTYCRKFQVYKRGGLRD